MEKKSTPIIAIIFYIFGGIFLLISAFMLITAIGYTKTYLQSYDATFSDMWSHSLQYIIAQFGPYLGFGIVCLGIGKAISEMRVAAANQRVKLGSVASSTAKADNSATNKDLEDKVSFLAEQIEATREVLGIKIEEKEKRDEYRLEKLGRQIGIASDTPVDYEMPGAADTQARIVFPTEDPGPVPEITNQAEIMTMPAIPEVEEIDTLEVEEPEAPGRVPQIMRQSGIMAMPAIPTPATTEDDADELTGEGDANESADVDDADATFETINLDAFASRNSKRDTFSKNELKQALAREEALRELEAAQNEAEQESK